MANQDTGGSSGGSSGQTDPGTNQWGLPNNPSWPGYDAARGIQNSNTGDYGYYRPDYSAAPQFTVDASGNPVLNPNYGQKTIVGYTWVNLGAPPKGTSGASDANAAERNAIDSAHYQRSDAEQAIRDAADAAYQRAQSEAALYGHQSTLGSSLLDNLVKLSQDPAAGPLGLSAFAQYGGGAQNIAAGTHGAGIANPHAGLLDQLLGGLSSNVLSPDSPFNRVNNTEGLPAKIDPNKAPMMTPEQAAAAPNEAQSWLPPNPANPAAGMADGGMVIGGQKHYIVDEKGNIVANLTEDKKPEAVTGIPGGVEVTPLDPARRAAYEQSKDMGTMLGDALGRMLPPKTNFATGGDALFPGYDKGSTGGPGIVSQSIPGGIEPDRQTAIGPYFKPTTQGELPADATSPSSATRTKGYAELLGGALSAGDQAVPTDTLASLNAGKAPDKLLSANVLQTLSPSQRTNYFALLQQMGLGTPEDNQAMIKAGRPDTMI